MTNGDALTREANRLYWETDTPVTQLAARLGVSRGTLYNHTQPLPTGVECARCGGALVYANRQARDARDARCQDCGMEKRMDAARAGRPGQARGAGARPAGREAPRPPDIQARPTDRRTEAADHLQAREPTAPPASGSADSSDLAMLFTAVTVGVGALAAGIMLLRRRS